MIDRIFSKVSRIAIAAILPLVLVACEKKEDAGMARVPELTQAQTPAPGQMPLNMEHQAAPLSQMSDGAAPHGHAHDSATTGTAPHAGVHGQDAPATFAAAADPNTVIQAGQTQVMAGGNILQVAGLAFTVSDSWTNVKPDNAIRVAEYSLEGSGGPAEMAVFYFGRNQGGGIEDNVRRWAGQFTADGATTGPGVAVARMEQGDLRIALVKAEGTYDPGTMRPMAPKAEPKENYALFGVVVAGGPEGSVFIKVTGPKTTIKEQNEALEAMAKSARVSEFQ